MKTQEDYTLDILTKIRDLYKPKVVIVSDQNVIDICKKLANNNNIDQSEIEQVRERFNELCNYTV